MKSEELREQFLQFFEERDHERFNSDSLVPSNDPTLLFTSAGMNQFKDYFMGAGDTELNRATSAQKCLRTGDIENVGKTPHHLTFFEMLGNFSFGDYFKEEAIQWGWDLVTEVLNLSPENLVVSIYKEDEEAYQIWHDIVQIPDEHIYRFGEKENFWPANAPSEGPNGPCGPCSEIHYDMGPEAATCGNNDCDPACCDRFNELYNLVFVQYERQEGGHLEPLPETNIDTGMGLERVLSVLQETDTVFETDVFAPIINRASDLLETPYEPGTEGAEELRRIADHIRAATFLISDGVLPSNEGRGYVQRKLLRRAIDDALSLDVEKPNLHKLVDPIVNKMKGPYPKLEEAADNARNMIAEEEESYLRTIRRGEQMLDQILEDLDEQKKKTLPGDEAFLLYDTYGFPLERTIEIAEERGFDVDREGFEKAMEQQREQAREATKIQSDVFGTGSISDLRARLPETRFVGYHSTRFESEILALLSDGEQKEEIPENEEAILITRDTPFYAEAGGQVGDTGTISVNGHTFRVEDTRKHESIYLHHGFVEKGRVRTGEQAKMNVDSGRRRRVATHHSCTHILQAVLRDELGTHVQQAGSLVAPDRLRFDFTHPEQLSDEERKKIEWKANRRILEDHGIESSYTTMEKARERGALMFFGDKYGDIVRTVDIGGFSLELCGGTHLDTTSEASIFKITDESSVASGTRRIEAVCGRDAIQELMKIYERVREASQMLSTTPEHLPDRTEKLLEEISDLERELERARQVSAGEQISDLENNQKKIQGYTTVIESLDQLHPDQLRSLVDDLVKNRGLDIAFLASRNEEKVQFALRLSEQVREQNVSANDLIQETARIVGGGGGGRDDFAQAGGSRPERTEEAMDQLKTILRKELQTE